MVASARPAFAVPPTPAAIAYVTISGESTVTPINTATNIAGPSITVDGNPLNVVVAPDGNTVYVSSPEANVVTPIDTATNVARPAIAVPFPRGMVITPDGATMFVSIGATSGSAAIVPIDLATSTLGTAIGIGAPVEKIAITPNGRFIYVPRRNLADVMVIDTITRTAVAIIYARSRGMTSRLRPTVRAHTSSAQEPISSASTPRHTPSRAFSVSAAVTGTSVASPSRPTARVRT